MRPELHHPLCTPFCNMWMLTIVFQVLGGNSLDAAVCKKYPSLTIDPDAPAIQEIELNRWANKVGYALQNLTQMILSNMNYGTGLGEDGKVMTPYSAKQADICLGTFQQDGISMMGAQLESGIFGKDMAHRVLDQPALIRGQVYR